MNPLTPRHVARRALSALAFMAWAFGFYLLMWRVG